MTTPKKRFDHVFVCAGCDRIALAERSDSITCSNACRVRVHRHPEVLKEMRAKCKQAQIPVALLARSEAVKRLRPDLMQPIIQGTIELLGPEVRAAMQGEYWKLVLAARNESTTESEDL
jgi:hypothetical protein